MKKNKLLAVLSVLTAILLCSCSNVYRYTTSEFYSMNTVITVTGDRDEPAFQIEKLTNKLEDLYSATKSDSEIYKFNEDGNADLSEETAELWKIAVDVAEKTDGAYNPCLASITQLWGITSGKNYVPSEEEISTALEQTNFKNVKLNGRTLSCEGNNVKIDLGGIGKGYALEKSMEKALSCGAENVCLSFGGNVGVHGFSASRIRAKEKGWKVGITNPLDKNNSLGYIILEGGFVSVSGSYERFFEKDGKIYHHIFDGKTGKPAESDLASSCVISKDAALGDALSTALFVMGSEKAIEFYFDNIYDFEMILIKNNGEILLSPEIRKTFTVTDDSFTVKNIERRD